MRSTAVLQRFDLVSGSLSNQLEFHDKVFSAAEYFERNPQLKADWNERVRQDQTSTVNIQTS